MSWVVWRVSAPRERRYQQVNGGWGPLDTARLMSRAEAEHQQRQTSFYTERSLVRRELDGLEAEITQLSASLSELTQLMQRCKRRGIGR